MSEKSKKFFDYIKELTIENNILPKELTSTPISFTGKTLDAKTHQNLISNFNINLKDHYNYLIIDYSKLNDFLRITKHGNIEGAKSYILFMYQDELVIEDTTSNTPICVKKYNFGGTNITTYGSQWSRYYSHRIIINYPEISNFKSGIITKKCLNEDFFNLLFEKENDHFYTTVLDPNKNLILFHNKTVDFSIAQNTFDENFKFIRIENFRNFQQNINFDVLSWLLQLPNFYFKVKKTTKKINIKNQVYFKRKDRKINSELQEGVFKIQKYEKQQNGKVYLINSKTNKKLITKLKYLKNVRSKSKTKEKKNTVKTSFPFFF
jgi:hypothetical protein